MHISSRDVKEVLFFGGAGGVLTAKSYRSFRRSTSVKRGMDEVRRGGEDKSTCNTDVDIGTVG